MSHESPVIKVLHLEDDPCDAELLSQRLQQSTRPCDVRHVRSQEAFLAALSEQAFDLVLCDHNVPGYSGDAAVEAARLAQPDVPVIVVSGSLNEEEAVNCLRRGATDYLLKQRLERIVPAVERALRESARIVAQRAAERALREKDALLGFASRLVKMGAWAIRLPHYQVVWSRETADIFGLPESPVPTLQALLAACAEDDRARVHDAIARCAETGAPFDEQFAIVTPGERRTWVRALAEPVWHGSAIERIQGAVQDITAQRQSDDERTRLLLSERNARVEAEGMTAQLIELNKQLREQASLLDKATDAIFAMGLDQRVTYWNEGAARMYGWPPAEAVGRAAGELLGASSGTDEDAWRTVLAAGTWLGEVERRKRDGREVLAEAQWTLLRDDGARPQRVLVRHTDLTERRLLERQYQHAQKLQSVGQLAGGIAHDFNNLLTVINGLADFAIEDMPASNPLRADLQEIRNAGERAAALTRQLLAFSRKQILKPQVVDLNATVTAMERMLGRLIGEDIALSISLDPQLCDVHVDVGQIEQVIANVAVNARDAMPRGGALTITTRLVEGAAAQAPAHLEIPPGRYASIALSDDGLGMDAAVRERVFEPFFTTKGASGTGLGLATVYGIVKQSGGFIWLDTAVGRGTTVTVLLPAAAAGRRRTAESRKPQSGGSERVLVIEDVDGVRQFTERALRSAGYDVAAARDGVEAVAMLSDSKAFDLILTDVVMPRMGGWAVMEWRDEHCPGIKVLYMSGYTNDVIVRQGIESEHVDFLHKPFAIEDLLEKVREVLDR